MHWTRSGGQPDVQKTPPGLPGRRSAAQGVADHLVEGSNGVEVDGGSGTSAAAGDGVGTPEVEGREVGGPASYASVL